MTGYIDSYETMGLVDGPGVRFVVFMKGCRLRCLFCHNPETWTMDNSTQITPESLVEKIKRYKNYYGTDGGVTFSGGEPLLQKEFLIEALKLCHENNIHTALDTSGVGNGFYEEILKYVDLVILDVKAYKSEEYKHITGNTTSMDEFDKFLKCVQDLNKELWIRQVIVPNINDTKEYILGLKEYIKHIKNVTKVELLPYHLYGESKYKTLGIPYVLEGTSPLSNEKLEELNKYLND